jgi:hypothetical protein
MGRVLHGGRYPVPDASGMHTDTLDEMPRKRLLDQKFGLLCLLDICWAKIGRRNATPIDLT